MRTTDPLDDVALDYRSREIIAGDPELQALARKQSNDAYLAALKRAAAEQRGTTVATAAVAPSSTTLS